MSQGPRLDQHLVTLGLARSRTLAQRLIRAGAVQVGGRVTDKPSYAVGPGQQVTVTPAEDSEFVGRGALKLIHALKTWGTELRVSGRRCLDVGASTGGFTQVLLERGAAHVTALDVGHGQLVPELASDPRVQDLPGTNIRDVSAEQLGTFGLIVADVSFISLRLVLPAVALLLDAGGDVVFLVKPQFEVGREHLGHGGVVTSPAERARALVQVVAAAHEVGLQVRGAERSPVNGTHGNTEYLLWLSASAPGMMGQQVMTASQTSARINELTREDD